jgi:ribulose-phosphate 3-epimerase
MEFKTTGIKSYVAYMKRLMHYAHEYNVQILTIEPMSCLAEPQTLPSEILDIAQELRAYHDENPDSTAQIGYCFDVSHGYVDASRKPRWNSMELHKTAFPYTTEMHLKNTDKLSEATFAFCPRDRERGTIDIKRIRDFLLENPDQLPFTNLIGYLEIHGPKLGRDYSDSKLEEMLHASIQYLRETFSSPKPENTFALRSEKQSAHRTPLVPHPEHPARTSASISASMICAGMGTLEEVIIQLEHLGVAMLHWDIMYTRFVPNMPCGFEMLEATRKRTKLPFDVHLMVEDNEFFIRELAKSGVQQISVNDESTPHFDRVVSLIRDVGAKAGLALNPSTLPNVLQYVSELVDCLLVMTVNLGFAGRKLTKSALAKIRSCRTWLDDRGLDIPIEVDGNVSFGNIPKMLAAGASIFVVGNGSLFHPAASREENMKKIQAVVNIGLHTRSELRGNGTTHLVQVRHP